MRKFKLIIESQANKATGFYAETQRTQGRDGRACCFISLGLYITGHRWNAAWDDGNNRLETATPRLQTGIKIQDYTSRRHNMNLLECLEI